MGGVVVVERVQQLGGDVLLYFLPAFSIGSVANAMSFYARFRAANNSSKINGKMPFFVVERTKI